MRVLTEDQRHNSLLEAVFAADPSGVAVLTGMDLRFAFVNPAYRFLIPDPSVDPIGLRYDEIWAPYKQMVTSTQLAEVLEFGRPYQITDLEHSFPDGTKRYFTLQARRFQWDHQLAVLMLLWDETEQKKAKKALGSIALFPSQNPNPVLRTSPHGTMMYANKACKEIFPDFQIGFRVATEWQQAIEEAYQTNQRRMIEFETQGRLYAFDVVPIYDGKYVNLYGRDITQQRQVTNELIETNERLRSVLSSMTDLYVVFDREWRVVDVNPNAEHRYFPQEAPGFALGKVIWELLPQTVGGEFFQATHRAMETGQPIHFEAGSWVNGHWYEAYAHPRGNLLELYMRDISERRQAEEALRESEARLKRAQEIAHVGSWELDLASNHLSWSDEIYRIFGLKPQEFAATYEAFLERVHPEDREAVDAAYAGSIREGRDHYEIEHRVIRKSTGEIRYVHEKCDHIRDGSGQIIRSIGMVQDITEREQAEADVQSRAIQIEIHHRLLEQREEERLQIARALHDGPVQEILAALYGVQSLCLHMKDQPELMQSLGQIQQALKQQVESLRDFAGELRPPTLSKFGLEATIRSHMETFCEKHPEIQVSLAAHQEGELMPEPVRLALYRIYQEALTNILKHAKATKIQINLNKDDHRVMLEIQDNGRGFEVPEDWIELARHKHLGLVGMRERADAVGGLLIVTSQPGSGTTLRVDVPLT